jgi:hypothetical protein
MRAHAVLAVGTLLLGAAAPLPLAAQPQQVPVCPSQDKAQQVLEDPGGPLPDGCRLVAVRRVDTPAGPLCAVNFGQGDQGLLEDLVDAAVTTRWWTACANLQPPP